MGKNENEDLTVYECKKRDCKHCKQIENCEVIVEVIKKPLKPRQVWLKENKIERQ